jgi:rhodanese-related sulfurtransferase
MKEGGGLKRAFLIILVLVGTVTGQFNQDTLKRWMKMGPPVEFILIDLRGPQDNITQVIANDKCKPYNLVWPDEFKSLIPKIPKDKHIVVYCRSGARSVQGASYLTSEGFSNVHDAGGFMNWTDTVRNISESIMADSLLPAPSMVPFTGVNMSIDKSVVATKSKAYTGVCLQRNYFNDESGVTLHGRIVHGVHNASNIHLYKYVNVYR